MRTQLGLLLSRRFLPIFLAQFGGALNDNLFKSALLVVVAFQLTDAPAKASTINNFAAILFILPYFLLSTLAGQLADRSNKARMIQNNKIAEISISFLCLIAFWTESLAFLLTVLVLLGAQSAMFGPNKYAILPQLLQGRDLVKGNALIATGTFVALLVGVLLGALLAQTEAPWVWIGLSTVTIAFLGYLAAKQLPQTEIGDPGLKIDWNLFGQGRKLVKIARNSRTIWLTILGVSWFWFFCTAYMTQIPALVRFIGGGDQSVVTLFLMLFIGGIGVGCALSAWLSGAKPELGIIPYALTGLAIAGFNFAAIPLSESETLLTAKEFIASQRGIHICIDVSLIGLFSGAFAIPLYIELQYQTRRENRARMVALSNLLNAFAMVLASLLAIFVIGILSFRLTDFLVFIAVLNGLAAIFFFRRFLLDTLRLTAFFFSRCLYRVDSGDMNRIPESGAALLVCNHLSYADPVIISGAVKRPIRFLMDYEIYNNRLLKWVFDSAGAIPLCSPIKNRSIFEAAMETAVEALKNGELVLIFPEGGLTRDGTLLDFKRGFEKILDAHSAPVYPIAIKGLWGSFFSHGNGPALRSKPKLPWYKVTLRVGNEISAEEADTIRAREEVAKLLANLTPS